jgi:osmotically-inducible protein OsmY
MAVCLCGLTLSACAPVILAGTGTAITRSVVSERSTMDTLTDSEIRLGIENRLMNHSHELFGDVKVSVYEGRVLLAGSVPRHEDKAAASKIAWETEGVTAVEDAIVVAADNGRMTYLADAKIGNAVRLKLLRDRDIASQNYDVTVFENVVHLTGLARSRNELDRAIRHAQEVKGVNRVVSHVLTVDDPRRVRATAVTG